MRALPKSLLTAMLLVLAMLLRAPAQQSPAAVPPGASELYELVSDAPDNPVIRMRVSHDHGWNHTLKCHGYLYVSRESIRYEVVRAEHPHSFEFAPSQIRSLKEWWPEESPVSAELRFTKGPNYHFALLTQKQFDAAVERGSLQVEGTSIMGIPMLPGRYIVRAIAKFDTVVEELRAAQRATGPLPAAASAPAYASGASTTAVPAAPVAQAGPAPSPAAQRNLLVNPGFEEGPNPGDYRVESAGSTEIPGWTVTAGTVDIGITYYQCPGGSRSIDLTGTSAGALAQTFPTQAGKKYRVSFAEGANFYGGPAVKKFCVKAAGQLAIFSYDTRTTKGWHTETWEFTANSDQTSLEFASLDPEESGAGGLLDNVSVVEVPAIAPVFKLLDPAGAEGGKPLANRGESLRLRGLVSHPAGVTALSLNGNSLPFETINPQTAAFDAPNQMLQPGKNELVLLAKGADQGEARFVLVVLRPGIRLLEPAQGQTAEAAITLRGVAVGLFPVARAEIAGRPAALQPQPDASTQFEVQAVPLALGTNQLEAVFTGAQGEREVFPITLTRVPPAGPAALSVREVEDALRSGIPLPRVAAMVTLYGVDFALTADVEQQLRAAGADDALLLAISKAKK